MKRASRGAVSLSLFPEDSFLFVLVQSRNQYICPCPPPRPDEQKLDHTSIAVMSLAVADVVDDSYARHTLSRDRVSYYPLSLFTRSSLILPALWPLSLSLTPPSLQPTYYTRETRRTIRMGERREHYSMQRESSDSASMSSSISLRISTSSYRSETARAKSRVPAASAGPL